LIKLIVDNLRLGLYSTQDFAVYWDNDYDKRVSRFDEVLDDNPFMADYWGIVRNFLPLVRVSELRSDDAFVEGIPVEIWNEAEEQL
jgi:hypothetical protein